MSNPSDFPPCPTPFTDHVYRTVAGVALPVRVWPTAVAGRRPWLLWLHGGGFTSGKHCAPNSWVVPGFTAHGYHVVSVAYRFLPHVALAGMLDDAQAALDWARAELPAVLGAGRDVDIDAYVVGGDSAGGTLSALCGHHLGPRPRVVVDVFGPTDFLDPFFHAGPEPETAPANKAPPPLSGRFPLPDVQAALADRDASHAGYIGAFGNEMEPALPVDVLRSYWGMPEYTPGDADWLRMDMLNVMGREKSLMLRLVGADPLVLDDAARAKLAAASPRSLVADGYPPTFVLHGEADSVVPVDAHGRAFAAKLKEHGVPVGECYPPGAGHCFEQRWTGPHNKGWNEYIEPTLDFVDKHIGV